MEAEGSRTTRAARRLQQGELCDVMVTLTCDDGAEGCGAAGIADYESLQLADDADDRDGTVTYATLYVRMYVTLHWHCDMLMKNASFRK